MFTQGQLSKPNTEHHIELQREPGSEHNHHLFLLPSRFAAKYDKTSGNQFHKHIPNSNEANFNNAVVLSLPG